ncbi:unnamed protein product, partial [marine sediment metagenome]
MSGIHTPLPIKQLNNLVDVQVEDLITGQILVWNSTLDVWENKDEIFDLSAINFKDDIVLTSDNPEVSVSIGTGTTNQADRCVAIGDQAGENNQGQALGNAVAIGHQAGQNNQTQGAVAIGLNAGKENQEDSAVAIGLLAGEDNQG